MQLTEPGGATLRRRLSAAACVLLAAGAAPASHAEPAPQWQLEGSALVYGEANRANVFEPVARITRMFASGQSLAAQFTLDAMTGASPTGAMPTGRAQPPTSASGQTTTTAADVLP